MMHKTPNLTRSSKPDSPPLHQGPAQEMTACSPGAEQRYKEDSRIFVYTTTPTGDLGEAVRAAAAARYAVRAPFTQPRLAHPQLTIRTAQYTYSIGRLTKAVP